MRLLHVRAAPRNNEATQRKEKEVSDTEEYWDEVILEAVRVSTTPSLFSDSEPTYRELFEKEQYISMGIKAYEDCDTSRAVIANLLIRKQKDYGPSNIMDGPFGPDVGIKVRLWDKVARCENLTGGGAVPEFEPLEDTLLDIIGYVCLQWMVAANAMNYPLSTEGTK
jgi:hypothetical protein